MKNIFLLTTITLLIPSVLFAGDFPNGITFSDAAELAIGASADLRNEYAQNSIRERAWRLGVRSYFPSLTLTAGEDDRLSLISTDSFVKNYALSIAQMIFDGGKLSASRRLARADMAVQRRAIERAASEIGEAAISAYRQVLFSRAILQIKEAGLVSLNEQRRILALEVSLGLALSTDLAQADLTIADARIEILSSEVDIAEAEQQFAEFLGLETIPFLAETVDIRRGAVLPSPEMIRGLAIEKNPELAVARYSIAQRQEQLKIASRSWIPTVKLTGSFGLSGQQYPLTRYNWSIGISLDFSSPFFSNTAKATFGSEPPYDKTAQLQNSLTPLSDLASALDIRSARMALDLEKSKYETSLERAERLAINALEKCSLIEKKRSLSVQALELAAEKLKLDELRFNLGQLIRIDMMDAHIEYTQQEAAAVEAAIALMEAERELERSLDLTPGGLMRLAVGD